MAHVPEIITANRPPEILDEYYADEVIVKKGQPPKGYSLSYELDILTKKEVDVCSQVDPNLLYQCPDIDKFYPTGIRSALGLPLNVPLNSVPVTIQDRRRLELTSDVKEFKERFRFILFVIAVLALVDVIIIGYHIIHNQQASAIFRILLIIISFGQFLVCSEAADESTLVELMPAALPHKIPVIIQRAINPVLSMISIEMALLIFTCIQRYIGSNPITFDIIILTVTLMIKICLLIIILFITRHLRNRFDRINSQNI